MQKNTLKKLKQMSNPKTELPRCNFLTMDAKRCRRHSAIKHRVHLDQELYDLPAYVEVNLCAEHFIHLGGSFKPKSKKLKL